MFISNYAFSEVRYDLQQNYYSKTIANSKNGYITYNNICEEKIKKFTIDDCKNRINNLNGLPEEPKCSGLDSNCILIW